MKTLLTILLISFFSISVFSQDSTKTKTKRTFINKQTLSLNKNVHHEIGLNVTFFFKQFLSFNSETVTPISPYLFTYKVVSNNRMAFRFGIGGEFTNTNDEENNRKTKTGMYDMRFGFEGQKQLGKRFTAYFGVDFTNGMENDKTISENDVFVLGEIITDKTTIKTTTSKFGFGPVMGLQCIINKHLVIYTEGAFYLQHSKIEDSTSSSVFPEFNEKTAVKEFATNFLIPTSLFISVRL